MQIEIKDNIVKTVREYCDINNHSEDWVDILNNLLYKGLMISKYGSSPKENQQIERVGTKDFLNRDKINETSKTHIEGMEKQESNSISRSDTDSQKEFKPKEKTTSTVTRRTIKRTITK